MHNLPWACSSFFCSLSSWVSSVDAWKWHVLFVSRPPIADAILAPALFGAGGNCGTRPNSDLPSRHQGFSRPRRFDAGMSRCIVQGENATRCRPEIRMLYLECRAQYPARPRTKSWGAVIAAQMCRFGYIERRPPSSQPFSRWKKVKRRRHVTRALPSCGSGRAERCA